MDGFAPRERAAVEYWFWKFTIGELAFLVDFIVRRKEGRAEVRVSQWLRGTGRVIHVGGKDWATTPDRIRIGASELRPGRSVGTAEDVSWDLTWTDGDTSVMTPPRLVARAGLFDTTVLAWPFARFAGTVRVGSEQFQLRDLPGTFSHYWGRRLADRWIWLSATSFDGTPGRRFEAIVGIRSRLFGVLPYPIPLGFIWTTDGERSDMITSTVDGMIRTRPVAGGIDIEAVGLAGARHRIAARWGKPAPNDIGDGIIQTMHADLTVDGARALDGTVGLEARGWPALTRTVV